MILWCVFLVGEIGWRRRGLEKIVTPGAWEICEVAGNSDEPHGRAQLERGATKMISDRYWFKVIIRLASNSHLDLISQQDSFNYTQREENILVYL